MYRGKYPHKIKSVESLNLGQLRLTANNGKIEHVHAEAIFWSTYYYLMPQLGEDIRIYSGMMEKWGCRNVM